MKSEYILPYGAHDIKKHCEGVLKSDQYSQKIKFLAQCYVELYNNALEHDKKLDKHLLNAYNDKEETQCHS